MIYNINPIFRIILHNVLSLSAKIISVSLSSSRSDQSLPPTTHLSKHRSFTYINIPLTMKRQTKIQTRMRLNRFFNETKSIINRPPTVKSDSLTF